LAEKEEYDSFMKSMKTILPASFRIGSDVPQAFRDNLLKELEEMTHYEKKTCDEGKDESINLHITKIPFVKDAFQFISLDRKTMRRAPRFQKFHKWLVANTQNGFITRQETVSMLPPVALDVQPHHRVLDMCAAPGSKTSQMLETIASGNEGGFIVANDSDAKRAYMLVHQLRRLNSPAIFVTSADARFFPKIYCGKKELKVEDNAGAFFDRVLCDVPCGGDGTLRKNIQIWRNWTNSASLALHSVQLSIAIRGLYLTKVGGTMCYSTCSINPVENEAVVCEILRRYGDSVRLKDLKGKFDALGFKGRPGMTSWKVLYDKKSIANKAKKSESNGSQDETPAAADGEEQSLSNCDRYFRVYESMDDVPENNSRIIQSMFPPTKDEIMSFNLNFCMRVHPQDNDSGGFFVAIFEKISPLMYKGEQVSKHDNDAEKISSSSKTNASSDVTGNGDSSPIEETTTDEKEVKPPMKKAKIESSENKIMKPKKQQTDLGNVPFIPVEKETWNVIWSEIRDFYGFASSVEEAEKHGVQMFPTSQLKARSSGEAKCLYFVTDAINNTLIDGDSSFQDKVTVINTGLKAFCKNTRQCTARYRLHQEGVHLLIPYFTLKRKIVVSSDEYKLLVQKAIFLLKRNKESKNHAHNLNIFLEHDASKVEGDNQGPTILDEPLSDAFVEKAKILEQGSFVVVMEGYERSIVDTKMALVFWKSRGDNINILVAMDDLLGIERKLTAV